MLQLKSKPCCCLLLLRVLGTSKYDPAPRYARTAPETESDRLQHTVDMLGLLGLEIDSHHAAGGCLLSTKVSTTSLISCSRMWLRAGKTSSMPGCPVPIPELLRFPT